MRHPEQPEPELNPRRRVTNKGVWASPFVSIYLLTTQQINRRACPVTGLLKLTPATHWMKMKPLRALVLLALVASAASKSNNDYYLGADRDEVIGAWGGTCTCPDGEIFFVGDLLDACKNIACVGGVSGECGPNIPALAPVHKSNCRGASPPLLNHDLTPSTRRHLNGVAVWVLHDSIQSSGQRRRREMT